MGAMVFGEAKNDCSWGLGRVLSLPGGPGWCLGEGMGAKPPNNFFSWIKHTKMVIVRMNIG